MAANSSNDVSARMKLRHKRKRNMTLVQPPVFEVEVLSQISEKDSPAAGLPVFTENIEVQTIATKLYTGLIQVVPTERVTFTQTESHIQNATLSLVDILREPIGINVNTLLANTPTQTDMPREDGLWAKLYRWVIEIYRKYFGSCDEGTEV